MLEENSMDATWLANVAHGRASGIKSPRCQKTDSHAKDALDALLVSPSPSLSSYQYWYQRQRL